MKKSKRQSRGRDSVSGGQDRISGLPDAVLCHMLLFLQTIYAVRTSVLCTRWKKIWESVPNLDFNRGPFRAPAKLQMFADHVLFLRNASNIKNFVFIGNIMVSITLVLIFGSALSWSVMLLNLIFLLKVLM